MTHINSFIVSPLDEEGQVMHDVIISSLNEIGVNLVDIDTTKAGAQLAGEITNAIDMSDFIVVDISRQKPNVMYELGYAHGTKKNTILITNSKSDGLPTNLMGYLYIPYDPDDMDSFRLNLIQSARVFIERKEAD